MRRRRCAGGAALLSALPAPAARAAGAGGEGDCVVQSQVGATSTDCKPGTSVPPGTICDWKKTPGYNCDNAAQVICDKERTSWWNGNEKWSVSCHPHKCSGGPFGPSIDPNAHYHACTATGATGSTCNPTCVAGYHLAPPTSEQPGFFTLLCFANLSFDAAGDPPIYRNHRLCIPDRCSEGPRVNLDPHANYDTCSAKTTGDTCVPPCAPGYTVTGEIKLECDEKMLKVGGGYDAAGATCEANKCKKPVAKTADPHATFTECAQRHTGETCTPVCPAGYDSGGAELKNLVCSASGGYDASKFTCTPRSCGGGAAAGSAGAGVDVSQCTKLHTGDKCIATCTKKGYVLEPPRGAVEGFPLKCVAPGNTFNASRVSCQPAHCSNGPSAGKVPSADYSACDKLKTGDTCSPQCQPGYHVSKPIELVCDGGTYDASAATCEPNHCSAGPSGAAAAPAPAGANASKHSGPAATGLEYEPCLNLVTGQQCHPRCSDGLVMRSPHGFALICDAGGKFHSPGGFGCTYKCTGGPVAATADPRADYAACSTKLSGDVCDPACNSGYHLSGSGFPLDCRPGAGKAAGKYDASGAQCDPNDCSGGTSAPAHMDLAACAAQHTGDKCEPRCAEGYTPSVTEFTLSCTAKADGKHATFKPSGDVECTPQKCVAPKLNKDPAAGYANCAGKRTGDSCELSCKAGQHGATPLTLTCGKDGGFDAQLGAGVKCTDNVCRHPGTEWTGFSFQDPNCTTVQACKKAGMTCKRGHRKAPKEEGGIQLLCPVWQGIFVPTGCNGVKCPRHAEGLKGKDCHCKAGFSGKLDWDGDKWTGICTGIAGYIAPSENHDGGSSGPGLWILLILLLLILLLLFCIFLKRRMVCACLNRDEALDVTASPHSHVPTDPEQQRLLMSPGRGLPPAAADASAYGTEGPSTYSY